MTLVVRVDPTHPDPASIARAAACLRDGGLVAFPTETVYGLGAHALDRAAVRRVFEAKGRPSSDPLIVHVASIEQLTALTRDVPPEARLLADRFWPGPLTLVLKRRPDVPDEVTAGLDTVAIRIPSHPVARALLAAANVPVAAPSANLFSRPSPTSAAHVLEDLDDRIDMIVDAGATQVGLESTVLDLTHDAPVVLRPGAISVEELRTMLPAVTLALTKQTHASAAMPSPGLLDKHYAPRAPLTLYEGPADAALPTMASAVKTALERGERVGLLGTRADLERIRGMLNHPAPASQLHTAELGEEGDLPGIARRLYAALRSLDAGGVDSIVARGVTAEEGLGSAIRDRLRRAAAGRIVSS